MTLVLIDLDGTLLTRKGSEVAFALHLLRRGMLGPRQIAAYLGFYLRWTWHYGITVTQKNKAYLCGLRQDEVEAMATEFARRRLRHLVRPALYERLQTHQLSGHTLVLLTGSLDCIARPLAELLGIGHVRATRCAMRNGRFTAAPPLIHPSGIEKLHIARTIATELNSSLSDCIAYADSQDDLPLLLSVGEPVAVNPDSVLLCMAIRKGWAIQ
jgi:HAD superfamily hydrolase (TIGR01490 family)